MADSYTKVIVPQLPPAPCRFVQCMPLSGHNELCAAHSHGTTLARVTLTLAANARLRERAGRRRLSVTRARKRACTFPHLTAEMLISIKMMCEGRMISC